jgi:hypothetical protein
MHRLLRPCKSIMDPRAQACLLLLDHCRACHFVHSPHATAAAAATIITPHRSRPTPPCSNALALSARIPGSTMTASQQLQPYAKPAAIAGFAGASCYALHSAGAELLVTLIMFFVSASFVFLLLMAWVLGGRGFGVGERDRTAPPPSARSAC